MSERCLKCKGQLCLDLDRTLTCINCGWSPPLPPLDDPREELKHRPHGNSERIRALLLEED